MLSAPRRSPTICLMRRSERARAAVDARGAASPSSYIKRLIEDASAAETCEECSQSGCSVAPRHGGNSGRSKRGAAGGDPPSGRSFALPRFELPRATGPRCLSGFGTDGRSHSRWAAFPRSNGARVQRVLRELAAPSSLPRSAKKPSVAIRYSSREGDDEFFARRGPMRFAEARMTSERGVGRLVPRVTHQAFDGCAVRDAPGD
jgi:hypothetical protein